MITHEPPNASELVWKTLRRTKRELRALRILGRKSGPLYYCKVCGEERWFASLEAIRRAGGANMHPAEYAWLAYSKARKHYEKLHPVEWDVIKRDTAKKGTRI
jgi:hypothetical protein